MAAPIIQTSFTVGEVTPSLWGHVDLARMHSAAATMRNMVVSYRGGAYSRAGTKFVGYSKQINHTVPPRIIGFQFSINQGLVLEFGDSYMRVIQDGGYVLDQIAAITGASISNPVTLAAVNAFSNGDWVEITDVVGMTQLNGGTYIVAGVSGLGFQLNDVFGNPVNGLAFSAYVSGGTVSRIYTLATPYGQNDLEYLKFVQSADVMTITTVNQVSATEYPPYDLRRISNNNWTLTQVTPAPTIAPPASGTAVATAAGTVNYQYVVTAVSAADGSESIASVVINALNSVDMSAVAGSIDLTWSAVVGADYYNIYKCTPSQTFTIPVGVPFGYAGTARGVSFIDRNIIPDFSQTPPLGNNPFAPGAINDAVVTAGGAGYTFAAIVITTATGTGAIVQAIINLGAIVGTLVVARGSGYLAGDTAAVTGDGAGATVTLSIGSPTGTYPSDVSYFQQRRAFAGSLNQPDTYWMSKPGAYNNFDIRIPVIDSDAIEGTPWALQVNGIQWMIPMPGGLVVLTGLGAWQVSGSGGGFGASAPITPSSQSAQPQAYNGAAPTIPPIKIDYAIIYVQSKGSIVREISYNLNTNIYTGADITINSSHLFNGYTIREWAWCEEPYKVLWAVRDDGTFLSCTYVKPQEVVGWARHDTQGQVYSMCAVTEPPVDALYMAVLRPLPSGQQAFFIERMDNRLWRAVEDSWCVDCGLALPLPTFNAEIFAGSATGLGAVTGISRLVGGDGYSSGTTATVVDDNGLGPGIGAVPTIAVSGGRITSVGFNFGNKGAAYVRPKIVFFDPNGTGSGADADLVLDNSVLLLMNPGLFSVGLVGGIIRMGGGKIVITSVDSAVQAHGQVLSPITDLIANTFTPRVQPAGDWTLSAQVVTVGGLQHLANQFVTGLYDGHVLPSTQVSSAGVLTLPAPASSVVIGLGYSAQLQSVYLDSGQPTLQGQRKRIAAVTARVELSRDLKIGCNQIDGSSTSPTQTVVRWTNLNDAPNKQLAPYGTTNVPLYTGDVRIPVAGTYETPGQVAMQQDNPLPMQVLAFVPEVLPGDIPQTEEPKRRQQRGQA